MAIGGCLFRMTKAGIAALQGDSDKVAEELDKADRALKRPPLCETGDALSDLFDDIFDN